MDLLCLFLFSVLRSVHSVPLLHSDQCSLFCFNQICAQYLASFRSVLTVVLHSDLCSLSCFIQICALCFASFRSVLSVLLHSDLCSLSCFIQICAHCPATFTVYALLFFGGAHQELAVSGEEDEQAAECAGGERGERGVGAGPTLADQAA